MGKLILKSLVLAIIISFISCEEKCDQLCSEGWFNVLHAWGGLGPGPDQIDSIFSSCFAPISIMKSGDANYQDTFDFIFTGAVDYLWLATYALIKRMGLMPMAYRDNVSCSFTQRVAQIRRKGISNYGSLFASEAKTRMA